MKTLSITILLCTACAVPAVAQDYIEFPPPILFQHVQHSHLTGRAVAIAPYPLPFPIRVYTTPPQQPYYNVPPYAVIAPY